MRPTSIRPGLRRPRLSGLFRIGRTRVGRTRVGRTRVGLGRGLWPWPALWLGVAAATAALVRLPGPAVLDPDEYAAALYFDDLVHGRRLQEFLLSAPKPLLTLVHGVAWAVTHDWRAGTALTVAAFALAVTALARAAGRLAGGAAGPLAGVPAALAVVVAMVGSGALILQVARGNSVIWALSGWAVALDALARPRRRWGLAATALLLAALARAETWLLLPPAALLGLLAWRRGDRGGLLLLVPLAAPVLWLGHDLLLAGDALYSLKVPERYTDLVSGRQVLPPAAWLEAVARRYARSPLLDALALLGVVWLARRRAWAWLTGLGVITVGTLTLFGAEAWRGTYISFRYFDPADAGLRVLAALGAAWLATRSPALLDRARQARPGPAAAGTAAGVVMIMVACWPLAPVDGGVGPTLDRSGRSSRNTARAIRALRPVAGSPSSVVVVSGPQRYRIALELGLPLDRVRDLYLGALSQPLDRALSGATAVYHDRGGDQPGARFAPLEVTAATRVGTLRVEPLLSDPRRGLYVLQLGPAPANFAPSPSD
jgi:hypothetical protein